MQCHTVACIAHACCMQTACLYSYRVRALPMDEDTDASAAIQTIVTDVGTTPQPCWPPEASSGWPFCSHWRRGTFCASALWDARSMMPCEPLPTPGGGDGGGGDTGGGDDYDYP
jgi:hypothetical protein